MYYVAYIETEPCYFRKVFYKSYSLELCRSYLLQNAKDKPGLYIFNSLDEIVE